MPTPDRARAGIEIISGEPIEVRRVARVGGEWVIVGLPRDRILITGDIVVNGSPDRRYRDQTMEHRAALTLCQSLPYTRILPSRGRPGGRELYESMPPTKPNGRFPSACFAGCVLSVEDPSQATFRP